MKKSGFKNQLKALIILVPLVGCQENHSFRLSQELGALKPTSARPYQVYKTCDQKSEICLEMNTIDGSQLKIRRNQETNTIYAQGEITITDTQTGKDVKQTVELEGEITPDGKIQLQPTQDNPNDYKVRAAVTCKDKNENGSFNCDDLLVDLVAKKDKNLFSTQLETNLQPKILPSPTVSPSPSKKETKKEAAPPAEVIGDGDDSGTPDRYVGASFEELKRLMDSTHLPKKEPSKGDKKVDPKNSQNPKKNSTSEKVPEVAEPPKKDATPGAASGIEKQTTQCKNSFLCDDTGKIVRPIDQAYGSPEKNNGRLTNASDLFEFQNYNNSKVHFEVRKPQDNRYFLTYELMMIIHSTAEYVQSILPQFTLGISDCSKKEGGYLSPHVSHRNGLDADIPYIIKNIEKVSAPMKSVVANNKLISDFDLEAQWKTFKFLVKTDKVDRIFIHQIIKKNLCQSNFVKKDLQGTPDDTNLAKETLRRLRERTADHADHFHLRVKCSAYDRRCQQSLPPAEGTGC